MILPFMDLETKVYQKANSLRLGRLLIDSLGDMFRSRFLARQLAIRDIKVLYRQSFLGIFWAFAAPLTTAFVWIFLNNSGTIRITDTGIPYPIYAFTGTLIWSILTESINSPMASTNSAKSIISKINFPKEALIISGIYKLLFNTSIKLLLLLVFLLFYGVGFHWSLLLFPFAILGAILLGTTIGLFLTPLGLLYKDIGKMISFGLQFLMYATPVVYSIPKDGIMKTLMEYNPLTPMILMARDLAVGSSPEYLTYFIIVITASIPLFFLALVIYRISIPVIVERLSA
jgi:lipopolysaccharide transport system permease protein